MQTSLVWLTYNGTTKSKLRVKGIIVLQRVCETQSK